MYLQEILFFHTEINVPTRKKFENQANKKEIKQNKDFHRREKVFSTR